MGLTKRALEEEQDRGYRSNVNTTVCTDCFQEDGIKKFIEKYGCYDSCSYCGSSGNKVIACELDTLIGYILSCIQREWGNPAEEGLPYETREGGWQVGKVYDTYDLLNHVGLGNCPPEIFNDICCSIHCSEWCQSDPYSLTFDKTLFYGWQEFSNFVKTKSRYFFLDAENSSRNKNQYDEINPVKIIGLLMSLFNNLGLIRKVNKKRKIYRVRIVEPNERYTKAKDLGSPPIEHAKMANRMSPAGISMFYGAFDVSTAIAETYEETNDEKKAIYGIFKPSRDMNVVDLTLLPSVPSIFDEDLNASRDSVKFIIDFVADFTKSIDRKDRAHVDYVPTQIITEYLRFVFRTSENDKIDGVMYPSSKSVGGKSIVIFASNEQCIDANDIDKNNAELILRLMKVKSKRLVSA